MSTVSLAYITKLLQCITQDIAITDVLCVHLKQNFFVEPACFNEPINFALVELLYYVHMLKIFLMTLLHAADI